MALRRANFSSPLSQFSNWSVLFNGSGGAEIFAVSANGGRALFTRNLGNIVMDLDDVLFGGPGTDILDGGPGDNLLLQG
jgi:hypothetical protein